MTTLASGTRRLAMGLLAAVSLFFICPGASASALTGYSAASGYQYLEMGTFPQTLEYGLEPILWRVLAAEGGEAYLLSEYVLENRRLDDDDVAYERNGGDFARTELYRYLNGAFLSHFTAEELALIQPDQNGGLFTLAASEDLKNKAYGFTGNAARQGTPTPYAVQNGLFQYQNGTSPYWTRSQSVSHAYAAICTKVEGSLGYIRVLVRNEGLRPACYLQLEELTVTGGSGTLQDPYQIGVLGGFGNE